MSSITTRAGKGSALTFTEGDDNFTRVAQTKAGNYTVVESDNRDTIEVSASATITLPTVSTIVAASDTGDFQVTIKNVSGGTITIACNSGTDTIEGSTSDYTLYDDSAATFKTNQGDDGYNIINGDVTTTGTQTLTNKTLTDPSITSGATDPKLAINTKVVDIGTWDMDATASVNVAHGLTLSKIRSISALIIADGALEYNDFMTIDWTASNAGGQRINVDATNVLLQRAAAGFFDSTAYNNGAINRGWIVISYVD